MTTHEYACCAIINYSYAKSDNDTFFHDSNNNNTKKIHKS